MDHSDSDTLIKYLDEKKKLLLGNNGTNSSMKEEEKEENSRVMLVQALDFPRDDRN